MNNSKEETLQVSPMKIKCESRSWCENKFEIQENQLKVTEKIELDESGIVLRIGFLGHYCEFEKKIRKYFSAICPNCGGETIIKREWGDIIGSGRVYYVD